MLGSLTGTQTSAAPTSACGAQVKPAPLNTANLSDQELSTKLTQYFHDHCLPLVSAQVSRTSGGSQQVLLYGFVASDFGKDDAQNKARQLLGQNFNDIHNSIMVRPQLAEMTPPQAPAASGSEGNNLGIPGIPGGIPSNGAVQQYQAQGQSPGGWTSMLAPLLGGLSIGGGMGSFGGMGMGSGVMISPGGMGMGMYPGYGYPGYPSYPMAPMMPMAPMPGFMPMVP
ncbi:MAG TPA: hypothetical protein VKV28_16920 [Candidatus Binataceae bacterium]|nr:hypothetical protein [Candidatus Binataceae bacterium]